MKRKMGESAAIAVCVFSAPPPNRPRCTQYSDYALEILSHAGVWHRTTTVDALGEALRSTSVLLTVGEAELGAELSDVLREWVADGGAWLAVSGTCGLHDVFGVQAEVPAYQGWGTGVTTLGEGYFDGSAVAHPALYGVRRPLHFFNGVALRPAGAAILATVLDAHQRPTGRVGAAEMPWGRGHALLIAPDVTGTVVRIQQGIAVTRDGVPASDNTAPCTDGILKADDGTVLDYLFDRETLEDAPGLSGFFDPAADQWRGILLRALFYLARSSGVRLPVLWHYPRNVPAIGHISHDTDGNDPAHARVLLETLERARVQSTWCTIAPGYDRDLTESIRAAGHELAMHYDAISGDGGFSEERFISQWEELVALFGEKPTTNKNHYLRWEGDCEFFEWLDRRGIQIDQTKGPSKTGQVGYVFGTCHPYFPVDRAGRLIDVLELPTPTQDLVIFCPVSVLDRLLEAALAHHGVLHLLFHPAHTWKPGVGEALIDAVERGRAAGMEWMTAREINAWERSRRCVRWGAFEQDAQRARVTVDADARLEDATILWLQPRDVPGRTVKRWGFDWSAQVVNLEGRQTIEWKELSVE